MNEADYINEKELKRRKLTADFMLFAVAVIWGGGFVAGKIALGEIQPAAILVYRFLGAAAALGVIFYRHILRAGKREIVAALILGCVQFSGQFTQLIGLQYTTAAKQSILIASYVVMTPFIVWGIKHIRPKLREILAGVIALVGVALISVNGNFSIHSGDLISLGAAFFFGLQIVLVEKYAEGTDLFAFSFFMFLVAGMLSLGASFLTKSGFTAGEPLVIASLLYIILLNTALAMVLQYVAQRYADSSHTAVLLSLESVFGYLFSTIFFRSPVTLRMLAGGILVFIAVFLSKGILGSRNSSKEDCTSY